MHAQLAGAADREVPCAPTRYWGKNQNSTRNPNGPEER
jgi:hypothetical protein